MKNRNHNYIDAKVGVKLKTFKNHIDKQTKCANTYLLY